MQRHHVVAFVMLVSVLALSTLVEARGNTNVEAGHWWPQGHPRRAETGQLSEGDDTTSALSEEISSDVAEDEHTSNTTHWTYIRDDAGPYNYGPAHWYEYDAKCGGSAQSPINIYDTTYDSALSSLSTNWVSSSTGSVINNGHTVQFNIEYGSGNTSGGPLATPYYLKQFHVHWNSEHTIANASYPLELHMVHVNTDTDAVLADATKELAVVGFMFQESTEENEFLAPLITSLTSLTSGGIVEDVTLDLSILGEIAAESDYYTYAGSLTAPNCHEAVTWMVLDTVVPIGGSQLEKIRAQFTYNNRPVQELNGRLVRNTIGAGRWNKWSECSATCGGGIQTRTCATDDQLCTGKSVRRCNKQSCGSSSSSAKKKSSKMAKLGRILDAKAAL